MRKNFGVFLLSSLVFANLTLTCFQTFAQSSPQGTGTPPEITNEDSASNVVPMSVSPLVNSQFHVALEPSALVSRIAIVLKRGSAQDPGGAEGLASLTANALLRGTNTKSFQALQLALDQLGAKISASVDHFNTTFFLTCQTRNLDGALALFFEVLSSPRFEETEITLLRNMMMSEIDESFRSAANRVEYVASQLAAAGSLLARPSEGSFSSLKSLKVADVVDFYGQHYNLNDLVIFTSSPMNLAATVKKFRAGLGQSLPAVAKVPAQVITAPTGIKGKSVYYLNDPGAKNYTLNIVLNGPTYQDSGYISNMIGMKIFGEGMNSWMFDRVRDKPRIPNLKKGFTYVARGSWNAGKVSGNILLQVAPVVSHPDLPQPLATVVNLVSSLVDSFVLPAEGPSEADLNLAIDAAIAGFPFTLRGASERMNQSILNKVFGMPIFGKPSDLKASLASVKKSSIQSSLGPYFDSQNMIIVVSGPEALLIPQIAAIPNAMAPQPAEKYLGF